MMVIHLKHRSEVKYWDDKWIYLGSNILELRKIEKMVNGTRISLSDEIHDQAKIQMDFYLKWTEELRKYNHDSLSWWMTHLAGRNNAASNLFLFICQYVAVLETVKKSKFKHILIVCENAFIHRMLILNFKKDHFIKISKKSCLIYYSELIQLIYFGLISNLLQIYKFFIHWFYAYKTRPADFVKPTHSALLFHQCLDDKAFLEHGKITGRYFTNLPSELRKEGYQVFELAWLNNVTMPLEKAYRVLRSSNFLIADDWLSLSDYFWAIKNSLKTILQIRTNINYPEINIKPLLRFEQLKQISANSSRFWRYIPMIKRWSRKLKIRSLTYYDHYENIFFEHPIRYFIRKLPIEAYSIGFYHSLHSKNYLGFHHLREEWSSKVKPDRVVCFGSLSKKILIQNGTPSEIIFTGSGLRQQLPSRKKGLKSEGDLLILLSLNVEFCVELLEVMFNYTDWFNRRKMKVKIKIHPSMKTKVLKNALGKKIPENWLWERGDIHKALSKTLCCVAMATGSVFDAILNGCYVIPVQSDLLQMDNYLDIFEDDYPLMKAIKSTEIIDRLLDIYYYKNKQIIKQHLGIQEQLYNGINKVNNKTISDFYPFQKIKKKRVKSQFSH